jgi:transcription elongation factor GreA
VIDVRALPQTGRVVFGATVELESQVDSARVTYQIVGEDEADIKAGRIFVGSPIARALIGKSAGDSVQVQTPGGVKGYEILDVRYE